jgi:hypothetical protein
MTTFHWHFSTETYRKFVIIFNKEQKNKIYSYGTSTGQYKNRQHRKFADMQALRKDAMKQAEKKKHLTSVPIQKVASQLQHLQ